MEVMVAPKSRSPDFHTAPSSPPLFGEPFNYEFHYTSAPTSPTHASALYHRYSQPETLPASSRAAELFEFAFNSNVWSEISTADELFEKGRIRLLNPPPPAASGSSSPREGERGRTRTFGASNTGNRARESRSLSPLRDCRHFIEKTTSTAAAAVGGARKWRLKDLLLFRSASEGRATGRGSRDPLRKYTLLSSLTPFSTSSNKKQREEDSRCRSFSSMESGGGSLRRRGGPDNTSAHGNHYTACRAAAEEQKKKTPLPYQGQGLFGCLQFNPAIRNIAKGLSGHSSSRGRS